MWGLIIMSNRLDFNQLSGYIVRKDLSGQWPNLRVRISAECSENNLGPCLQKGDKNADLCFLMSNVSIMAQA